MGRGILDQIISSTLGAAYYFCCLIPRTVLLRWSRRLAGPLSRMLPLSVARKNLRIIRSACPESWGGRQESELLVDAVFNCLATVTDLFKLMGQHPTELLGQVQIQGWEHLEAALQQGRGVVTVSLHHGHWELTGALMARRGVPIHAFYQQQLSPALDRFLTWARRRTGMRLLHQRRGLRGCLQALKAGEVVGFVADQDGSRDGIFLEFFDRLVSMPRGPYEFARRASSPIVTVTSLRLADCSYSMVFGPPVHVELEEDIPRMAQETASRFESVIQLDPSQWLLFHDRFWPRHVPRLEELGLLERAEEEHRRDQSLGRDISDPPADPEPLPEAVLHRMTLIFYSPFLLAALAWMAYRGSLATLLWSGGAEGLARALSSALLLGATTVGLSRLYTNRTEKGRELGCMFRQMLGHLGPATVLVIALASSLAEEVLFRGALQPELGLFWTSLIFGLIHFPADRRLYPWTLFAIIMGFCLGSLYELTGGVFAPFLAHFLVNAWNLLWLTSEDASAVDIHRSPQS